GPRHSIPHNSRVGPAVTSPPPPRRSPAVPLAAPAALHDTGHIASSPRPPRSPSLPHAGPLLCEPGQSIVARRTDAAHTVSEAQDPPALLRPGCEPGRASGPERLHPPRTGARPAQRLDRGIAGVPAQPRLRAAGVGEHP